MMFFAVVAVIALSAWAFSGKWHRLLVVPAFIGALWLTNSQWGWLTGREMYGVVTWSYIDKLTGKLEVGVNRDIRPVDLDSTNPDTQSEVLFCSLNLVSAPTSEIHRGDQIRIVYLYWGPITDSKLLRYEIMECKHSKDTKPPVR